MLTSQECHHVSCVQKDGSVTQDSHLFHVPKVWHTSTNTDAIDKLKKCLSECQYKLSLFIWRVDIIVRYKLLFFSLLGNCWELSMYFYQQLNV